MASISSSGGEVRIGDPTPIQRLILYVLLGVGCPLIALAVPYLARVTSDLPWFPFQGPLELLASLHSGWLVWGLPLIAFVVGVVLAGVGLGLSPVLIISESEVVVCEGDSVTIIRREQIDGVRSKGKKVTIYSAAGRELFSDEILGSREAVRSAFIDHGYPWESGNPALRSGG